VFGQEELACKDVVSLRRDGLGTVDTAPAFVFLAQDRLWAIRWMVTIQLRVVPQGLE
jgi:hypothetical protein